MRKENNLGVWFDIKSWHIEPYGYFNDSDLRYHSSWDWLMPVWKKVSDEILGNSEAKAFILMAIADVEIELAFTRIVEMIKWHTKTKEA